MGWHQCKTAGALSQVKAPTAQVVSVIIHTADLRAGIRHVSGGDSDQAMGPDLGVRECSSWHKPLKGQKKSDSYSPLFLVL
jgi:hypothetical protein